MIHFSDGRDAYCLSPIAHPCLLGCLLGGGDATLIRRIDILSENYDEAEGRDCKWSNFLGWSENLLRHFAICPWCGVKIVVTHNGNGD